MEKVILYQVYDNDPKLESKVQADLYDLIGHQNFRIIPVSKSDNKFTVFAFLNKDEVSPLTNIFKKYGMFISKCDITKEVIMGKMPNREYQKEFGFVTYRKVLNEFRQLNTSVDDVLDIISESGMEGLDDLHRKILKDF